MATRREIRSDIILRLTKGKPSDDFEIDNRQIDFWIDTSRSAIIKQYIDSEALYGVESVITLFNGEKAVDVESRKISSNSLGINSVQYFSKLPGSVLNMSNDIGLYRVETEGGETIKRMKPTDVSRFKTLWWANPDDCNIAYYRVGDEIIYQGGKQGFLKNGKVNLYLVLENTRDQVSDNEEYPMPGSLISMLLDSCEEIGMRELQKIQDLENDGIQE